MAREPVGIWVERLIWSARTARKLDAKHGLDVFDVQVRIEQVEGLEAIWHKHPDRGLRAFLQYETKEGKVRVVLYPQDEGEDVWALGTAYRVGVREPRLPTRGDRHE